jgi:hypothetical protein
LVRVVDRIAPQISILGPNPIEHIRFTPYTEDLNNIRIIDNYYLEDTLKKAGYLKIDYSKLVVSNPGVQIVTIQVTDPSGNVSRRITRFVNVSDEGITGLKELGSNGQFNLYPNPTLGKMVLSSNNGQHITAYEIVDQLGKVVQSNTMDETLVEIDITQVKAGIYTIVFTAGQERISHRIIKQ